MAKYHINKHGVPALCKAQKGNCPYGGDEQHFNNMEDAQAFADKLNEDRYGLFKNVRSTKVYEIPEGTPQETRIDKNDFINNNHKLIKSGDNWVHLNDQDEVIGTMKEPIAIYDNDGELSEIADVDNYATKMSVQGLKALKTLSRFNLVSKDVIDATSSINFYSPVENIEEYKDEFENKNTEADIRSFNAFKARIEAKGGNKTSDLFRNSKTDSQMSDYFRKIEERRNRRAHKYNRYVNPEVIEYNPQIDNWEELPSAKDLPLKAWQDNNLDLQVINNKWAVIDMEGNIYGRLENPAVAVNFETETIECIGEYEEVNNYCESARNVSKLHEGNPSSLDMLGSVKFDNKNNNLNKIRNLLKFSWAFREPSE